MSGNSRLQKHGNMLIDLIWPNVQAKYLKQAILYPLNEIWLYENDPNAPSMCSEPGGKQWQHRIRGWRNREAGDLRRDRAHYDVIVMPATILPNFRMTEQI